MGPRYRPIMLSTLTLLALAAFDGMSVAAALPEIGNDLGITRLTWVLTAFLLSSTVSMLAAGTVIDTLGVALTYRITLILFFVASALCTVAPGLGLLIAARVLQGIGGGMVMATTISIIGINIPDHLRSRAYAANSAVWGVMALAGPALVALMVSVGSWRWIFAINLPLVLFAAAIGWKRVAANDESVSPEEPATDRAARVRFDTAGLLLVGVFTGLVLVGLSDLRRSSFYAAAAAVIVAAGYWWHSGRAASPILGRRYFATAPFGLLNAIPFTFFAGSLAVDAYIPLYVRGGLGRSTSMAAFAVAFLALGWTTGSTITSRLLDRIDNITVMLTGFGLAIPPLAVGAAFYSASTPLLLVFALSFMQGLGIGSVTNSTLSLLQRMATAGEMGRASSAHQFVRNLGGTFGTALAGAMLFAVVDSRLGSVELVRDLLGGSDDLAVSGPARDAISAGFRAAAIAALLMTLVGVGFALVTRRWLRRHPTDRGATQATDLTDHSQGLAG